MKIFGVILMVIAVILYIPVALGTGTFGDVFKTIALSNNIVYLVGTVCSIILLVAGAIVGTVGFLAE